ncbi:MAG: HNH endonuclease [Burkholderiaceae bacterium]|nr:HNH endonuclease [Burkholderiaceae bacterium]
MKAPARLDDALARWAVADGDCLRWTGSMVGKRHPAFTDNTAGRKTVLVRRALWERKHGPVPAGHVLRCTCGMERCVLPAHATPKTYQQIALECGALGLMSGPVRSQRIARAKRAGPQAKISDAQVAELRAGADPIPVLAERFGISEAYAYRVQRGEARRDHVTPWQGLMR